MKMNLRSFEQIFIVILCADCLTSQLLKYNESKDALRIVLDKMGYIHKETEDLTRSEMAALLGELACGYRQKMIDLALISPIYIRSYIRSFLTKSLASTNGKEKSMMLKKLDKCSPSFDRDVSEMVDKLEADMDKLREYEKPEAALFWYLPAEKSNLREKLSESYSIWLHILHLHPKKTKNGLEQKDEVYMLKKLIKKYGFGDFKEFAKEMAVLWIRTSTFSIPTPYQVPEDITLDLLLKGLQLNKMENEKRVSAVKIVFLLMTEGEKALDKDL